MVTPRFLERGIIPPITVLLFFWGLLLLLGKWWNGWYLRRALRRWRNGESSGATAPIVASLEGLAAGTARVEESLALLWRRYEESYLLPRYISWAVPILGFIGTVLGISLAADGIRRIIGSDAGISGLSSDLSGAIAPLGIAFDTTLIALSLSVVLTLFLSLVQRDEERILAAIEWEVRGGRIVIDRVARGWPSARACAERAPWRPAVVRTPLVPFLQCATQCIDATPEPRTRESHGG